MSWITGGIVGDIIGGVVDVVDDLHTSDEERLDAELDRLRVNAEVVKAVHETNTMEAAHRSTFVAGWRPSIGWVCGISLALSFIPKAVVLTGMWCYQNYLILSGDMATVIPELMPFPELGTGELLTLTLSLLGLGGLRTYEKRSGLTK